MEKKNRIIYNIHGGKIAVSLLIKAGSVWMNQNQLAELFATSKQNKGQHIASIFQGNALSEHSVVKNCFTTVKDGKYYDVV
jgi:hypothetical protein